MYVIMLLYVDSLLSAEELSTVLSIVNVSWWPVTTVESKSELLQMLVTGEVLSKPDASMSAFRKG